MCFAVATIRFQRRTDRWMTGGMCFRECAGRRRAFAYRACSHVLVCRLKRVSSHTAVVPQDQRTLVKSMKPNQSDLEELKGNNYNLSKQQTHACSSLPCSGFWASAVDTGSRQRRRFNVVTPRKKISAY